MTDLIQIVLFRINGAGVESEKCSKGSLLGLANVEAIAMELPVEIGPIVAEDDSASILSESNLEAPVGIPCSQKVNREVQKE